MDLASDINSSSGAFSLDIEETLSGTARAHCLRVDEPNEVIVRQVCCRSSAISVEDTMQRFCLGCASDGDDRRSAMCDTSESKRESRVWVVSKRIDIGDDESS
jgi:hypothetical protein